MALMAALRGEPPPLVFKTEGVLLEGATTINRKKRLLGNNLRFHPMAKNTGFFKRVLKKFLSHAGIFYF